MSDDIKETVADLRRAHVYLDQGKPFLSGKDCAEIADLIERQADQLLDARRTAEYWKAEHNSANARIAELEAQIAAVAPAVDAQPVAWFIADDNGEVYRATGYEHERDQWRAVGHAVFSLYDTPPSEGLNGARRWRK